MRGLFLIFYSFKSIKYCKSEGYPMESKLNADHDSSKSGKPNSMGIEWLRWVCAHNDAVYSIDAVLSDDRFVDSKFYADTDFLCVTSFQCESMWYGMVRIPDDFIIEFDVSSLIEFYDLNVHGDVLSCSNDLPWIMFRYLAPFDDALIGCSRRNLELPDISSDDVMRECLLLSARINSLRV
jgi:hypothetical protein